MNQRIATHFRLDRHSCGDNYSDLNSGQRTRQATRQTIAVVKHSLRSTVDSTLHNAYCCSKRGGNQTPDHLVSYSPKAHLRFTDLPLRISPPFEDLHTTCYLDQDSGEQLIA